MAFLPLGSQENRPFVNGSSVSAGGRGTAEAVLSCQLLPFQQKPEPSLPKFRSQIEAEIPAACPELSEEHLGKCTDPPQQLRCTQLPSSAHTQAALHHCPPQPLGSGNHRDAPKPSSSSHLQVPHTPLWQAKAAAGEQLESQPALQTSPCSRTTCLGLNPPCRFPNIRSAHARFSAVPGCSSKEDGMVSLAWTSPCCCFKSLRFKYTPGKHHNSIYSYS